MVGGRLDLQAKTISRAAYYVFVPAYIFQALSIAHIALNDSLIDALFYRHRSLEGCCCCRYGGEENNIAPHFVNASVLFSILASLVTLPLVMVIF